MSLKKAIESGKEKRKPYRRSKAFDRTCRNHGSCGYCRENRKHSINKEKAVFDSKLEDYLEEYNQAASWEENQHYSTESYLNNQNENYLENNV